MLKPVIAESAPYKPSWPCSPCGGAMLGLCGCVLPLRQEAASRCSGSWVVRTAAGGGSRPLDRCPDSAVLRCVCTCGAVSQSSTACTCGLLFCPVCLGGALLAVRGVQRVPASGVLLKQQTHLPSALCVCPPVGFLTASPGCQVLRLWTLKGGC